MKGWLLSRGSSQLHFQVPGFQGQHEFPVPSAIPGTAQALRYECSTLRPSLFWTLSADPGVPGLPPEILIIEVFLIIVHSGSSGRWFCFFFFCFVFCRQWSLFCLLVSSYQLSCYVKMEVIYVQVGHRPCNPATTNSPLWGHKTLP